MNKFHWIIRSTLTGQVLKDLGNNVWNWAPLDREAKQFDTEEDARGFAEDGGVERFKVERCLVVRLMR